MLMSKLLKWNLLNDVCCLERLLWLRLSTLGCHVTAGAGGEMQTYQIRTAQTSSSLPQTVVMTSPMGHSQGKSDDPTMKREIRLAKNRYVYSLFLGKIPVTDAHWHNGLNTRGKDYKLCMTMLRIMGGGGIHILLKPKGSSGVCQVVLAMNQK